MRGRLSIVRPYNRQLLSLLLIALTIYVIVPQLGGFRRSFDLLQHARWGYMLAAVGFTALTYLSAAGTYYLLAFDRLRYWRTVLVQVAGMFVNRLLPAGIGALGANYAYLRHSRHTKAQAATVVTINNSLGLVGHILLTVVILALFHKHLPGLHYRYSSDTLVWLKWTAVPILLLAALAIWQWGERLKHGAQDVISQLAHYKQQPWRVAGALLTSMSLTMGNILSLWLCLLALHGSLSFVAVLLVFTFGIGLGSATPTPGGLGGIEAGLVAGFVAFHVTSVQALATVLLYRFISYWLTLVVGAAAFVVAEQRNLFHAAS